MHQSLSDDAIDPINKKLKELLPFHMKDLVKGRVDKKCYKLFYSKFVSLIDKKAIWNEKLVKAKKEIDLVTVSNKAFALVTLEGQWDRWVDLYVQSNGKVATDKTLSIKSIPSSVPAKYTRGGLSNTNNKVTHAVDVKKGWTLQGIKRFNYFFQFVKQDRIKYSQFFYEWLSEERKLKRVGIVKRKLEKEFIKSNEQYAIMEDLSNMGETEGTMSERNAMKISQLHIKEQQQKIAMLHLMGLNDSFGHDCYDEGNNGYEEEGDVVHASIKYTSTPSMDMGNGNAKDNNGVN
jgi:hypothetical protein